LERIVLNSGLDGFLLIDAITTVDPEGIAGTKCFVQAPSYLGIESLAQLGALHVRFISGFERHAFLLNIKRCSPTSRQALSGCYQLYGKLASRSSSAYCYRLEAVHADEAAITGEFLFATVAYDAVFEKDILQKHYRKVFSCLQSGSRTNC
jgi:hypothetical protein